MGAELEQAGADAARCGAAITPRLGLAAALVDGVAADMRREAASLSRAGRRLAAAGGGPPADMLGREALARLAVAALSEARRRLGRLDSVGRLPPALAVLVPAARALSAGLHAQYPEQSARLSALAAVLGGVLADSASLAGARFDFGRSNRESRALLAEAKLIADSKLAKLYPNLGGRPRGAA